MNKCLGWVLAVLTVSVTVLAQTPGNVASFALTRSVVRVTGGGSCDAPRQGSGVVVAPGLVATNAHVAGESIALIVWKDDRSWPAQIEAVAPEMDLCLLRVPGLTVPEAEVAAPEQLMPGLEVISVGYPGTKTPVIQAGRLTFLWSYCGSKLIQSDALTQKGSSGGGLFSKDGRLLGITTFVFHSSGFMNFSIPAAWVKSLIQRPRPEAPIALCRPMDAILRDFLGEMSEDPANGENWEGFTRSWVKDNPKDPNAWTALGYALHRKLETQATANTVLNSQLLEETAAAATKAIQLDANHARAWNNLGVTLGLENRYEEAQRAYQKAI
ncbi:MAG: trypsin-like peptidase domain-containing protein, partial [Holophaga sp.]|nr:trypsin-like peptidase domain-containing protein [Holophaga sp.]